MSKKKKPKSIGASSIDAPLTISEKNDVQSPVETINKVKTAITAGSELTDAAKKFVENLTALLASLGGLWAFVMVGVSYVQAAVDVIVRAPGTSFLVVILLFTSILSGSVLYNAHGKHIYRPVKKHVEITEDEVAKVFEHIERDPGRALTYSKKSHFDQYNEKARIVRKNQKKKSRAQSTKSNARNHC